MAGGQSKRMGRDKSQLRLRERTLLGQIRFTAKKIGCPVRIIRRDFIPSCGPLGGLHVALKTTRAEAILFLACDMPFVAAAFLKRILRQFSKKNNALFTATDSGAGFPFLLRRSVLAVVEKQLAEKNLSMQSLAQKLEAKFISPSRAEAAGLLNINTPGDWKKAQQQSAL
ncbi:MAG: molybdenum cofactor guanylyltransferase [Verrucomicrobiota bacterium]|nr:molybdenum cofactor guanylyltransferase [Verrucomicrobiota bacterium]